MYCTGCGAALEDAQRFCPACGKPAAPDAAAPLASKPRKRLVRVLKDKKIAGVCAGFARYMDVDATLVRIIWLLVALAAGTGFIAYLVAWIAMPKEYDEPVTSTAATV